MIDNERDVDKNTLLPLPSWDGKPKNISDHEFLEIMYYPSMKSFILDPSFNLVNIPIDFCYSRYGIYHFLKRIPPFAL